MSQVGGYTFNPETVNGNRIRDLSGYFSTGVLTGSAAITTGQAGYGNALNCTGGAMRIGPVDEFAFPLEIADGLSVAAWVKLSTTTAAARCIMSASTVGGILKWALYASNASGNVEANIAGSVYSTSTSVRDGNWHHVMVVYDKFAGTDTVKMYVDSTLVLSVNAVNSLDYSDSVILEAGRNALTGAESLQGLVDDLRWWVKPVDPVLVPTVVATEMTDLQLGIYTFDSDNAIDYSPHDRDLTVAPSATFVDGFFGRALVSSSTEAGVSGNINLTDPARLYISGWIRLDVAPVGSPAPIMAIKTSGGVSRMRTVVNLDRTITASWTTLIDGVQSVTSTNALTVGKWVRVSIAINPTYVDLRVDRSAQDLVTYGDGIPHMTPSIDDLDVLYIGGDDTAGGSVSWNYVTLTENFLASLEDNYWSGPPVAPAYKPANITRGVYPFNEGSGSTVNDASTSGNDLTMQTAGSWITGIQGAALGANGTGPSASAAVTYAANPQGFAFAAWVRCRSTTSNRFLCFRTASGEAIYSGRYLGNFWVRMTGPTGNTGEIMSADTALTPEVWTHVAMSFNGIRVQLYVNGVKLHSGAYTVGQLVTPVELRVGGDSGQTSLADMDDLILFDTPVGDANVAWMFSNPGAMANLPVDVALGATHETDTAHALTPSKAVTLETGQETDSAHELTATKAAELSMVSEVDTAHEVVPDKDVTLATAAEVDAAYPLGLVKTVPLATVSEDDTVHAAVLSKEYALDIAHETDTVYPVDVNNLGAARVLQTAHETEAAYPGVLSKTVTLATVHEVDRALALIFQGSGPLWPVLTVSNMPSSRLEVSHGI